MSTNYTHFDQIAFDKLFGRKADGQEVQIMDSSGNLSGIGNITTTGALNVASLVASGTVTGSNLSGTNTGNVTIATANGLSLSGQALSMAAASTSATGVITTGAQSIAGAKTFAGAVAASNISGSTSGANTGDVTISTANGLSLAGQALSMAAASSSAIGVVSIGAQSFAGAKTFKSTVSASNLSGTNTGDQTITLTSDVTGSGTGSFATTIAANVVTNAKAAQMAANTIKGNNTAGTANASDLTVAQTKTLLNLAGTNSGDVTLTAVGTSPSANGASLSTQALTLQPADATHPGVISTSTQSVVGVKTFSSGLQLPTSGGTPTTLNYYEEGTFVANFNASAGVSGSNTSKTITYTRIGRMVTLYMAGITNMTSGTTAVLFATAASTVPTRLIPASNLKWPTQAVFNNTFSTTCGEFAVQTDGSLRIFRDIGESTSWTATTTNCGMADTAVTYSI